MGSTSVNVPSMLETVGIDWMRAGAFLLYSVTPKPGRRIFVNNEKVNKKYQFLMVRFSKMAHPTRYSEIQGFYDKIGRFSPIKDIIRNVTKMGLFGPFW